MSNRENQENCRNNCSLSYSLTLFADQNPESILAIPCVVGRIMASKDAQILIPGISDCVTLHGKKGLC